MEEKNSFDFKTQWPLYSGITLLVFAGLLTLSAFGHAKLLSFVLGTMCFVMVVIGFLAGSIFGAGFGLLVWFVIKKSFERFTVPCLILFLICGIGLIIWYKKKGSEPGPAAAESEQAAEEASGQQDQM